MSIGEIAPDIEARHNPNGLSLSIVMPAYNEGATIAKAITQVLETPFPCPTELIVVDDGSDDDTASVLAAIHDDRVVHLRHAVNQGKGAALATGFGRVTSTHVIPFDADLEYSPSDLLPLLEPVMSGRAEVVFGSRIFGMNTVFQSYRYAIGNKATTLLANVLFDAYLSDLHTCLKLFPVSMLPRLSLRAKGFGLDTEITAEMLKLGYRPFEVPISYYSRTHAQGKKLNWRDGVTCVAILFRVRAERCSPHGTSKETRAELGQLRLFQQDSTHTLESVIACPQVILQPPNGSSA